MKIDGVIVLFNPDESIIKNINSYINSLEKLYIVDNSEIKNNELIRKIINLSVKCNYIDNCGNKGIAQALNVGAKFAIKNEANWLLTMDQDTSFQKNDFQSLIKQTSNKEMDSIAIIAPSHYENENKINLFYNTITMTSGNLINLKIFQFLKGFDNNLFIDSVDTDFCLKIYCNKYKIKRVPSIVLIHNLGDIKQYKFLDFKFNPSNHNYIRRYYITRNRFVLWSKYANDYPEFIKWEKKATFKELIKAILFENNKFKKIRFMLKGYIDYKNNKLGKYEE